MVNSSPRRSAIAVQQYPVRFRLPRARGVKAYAMQIRGQNAGLEGEIQLVRSGPATGP